MDRLVWQNTKAHLYLVEAAHVKNAVGRDRIRRNKDTLRELRCLQEILADLHAGDFGRNHDLSGLVQTATEAWSRLHKTAFKQSRRVEDLCEIPSSVRRYLLAQPGVHGCVLCPTLPRGTDAASSTRAPSTVYDVDVQSTAAESTSAETSCLACDNIGIVADGMTAHTQRGPRLSMEQLDQLAAELREQLDQEFTSLLASIEEVQGLMEAEVVGVGLLPSKTDLDVFLRAAEAACCLPEEPAKRSTKAVMPAIEADAECKASSSRPVGSESAATAKPRWADLSDSEEHENLVEVGGRKDASPAAKAVGERGPPQPILSRCSQCLKLGGRSAFSRRAWRRAREAMLPATSEPSKAQVVPATAGDYPGAICLDCSGLTQGHARGAHT
mmetsp:Transcript_2476/g.6189  ORF Transcript_2476/g.6189 Transcript_2476/m.6189 type:complete len:385 (-) Transcript_2476:16-1170(-)